MLVDISYFLSESSRNSNKYHPFIINGIQVGLVRGDFLEILLQHADIFQLQANNVVLNPSLKTYDDRSKCVDNVLRALRSQKRLITLNGWRDEVRISRAELMMDYSRIFFTISIFQNFEVRASYSSESLLNMDRSATCK